MRLLVARKLTYGIGALVLLWAAFDLWVVRGTAIDSETGQPISDAVLLVSLFGQDFDPPYPHGWVVSSKCLRSVVVTTDPKGRFSTVQLTATPFLKRTEVSIGVLKEGWYLDGTAHIAGVRLPLGMYFHRDLKMRMDKGQRWSFPARVGEDPSDHELTLSRHLTEYTQVGTGGEACDAKGWLIVQQAITYGIQGASTAAEIEYVRLRCRDAQNMTANRRGDWRFPKIIGDDVLAKFPECIPLFEGDGE
jgi:hypothetical protein